MMRLLLLETKSAFSGRLATALSSPGLAHCKRVALSSLEKQTADGPSYDAVILDWRRDECDRLRVCRHISRTNGDRPIIAVTSMDDVNEAVRAVEAGAEDVCLRDELDDQDLISRIRMAVERFHARTACASQPATTVSAVLCGNSEQSSIDTTSFDTTSSDAAASDAAASDTAASDTAASDTAASDTAASDTAASDTAVPAEVAESRDVFRLLLVGSESERSLAPDCLRVGGSQQYVDLTFAAPHESWIEQWHDDEFDAIMISTEESRDAAIEVVRGVRRKWHDATVLLAVPDTDLDFSLLAIREGADDCLDREFLDNQQLMRSLQLAVARRIKGRAAQIELVDVPIDEPVPRSHAWSEPRQDPRYFVTRSAIAFPVRRDFTPDQSVCAEGFTCDVSETGIRFEVAGLESLANKLVVMGVEGNDGAYDFATVEVCNWHDKPGGLQIGGRFATPDRDLFRRDNLVPTFQSESQRFATNLPLETLYRWVELGVLRPVLVDRIYLCPKCASVPSFRSGCRACGSVHIASHRLIHHFSCAYLGTAREFEGAGGLVCPKCRAEELVHGTDFEQLSGPSHCLDCNWSGTDTEVVGQCLQCHWRFPIHEAGEEELIGFHVNRLDPYSLLQA